MLKSNVHVIKIVIIIKDYVTNCFFSNKAKNVKTLMKLIISYTVALESHLCVIIIELMLFE